MPVEPPADAENGTEPAPRSWFPSLTHTQALLGVVTVVLGIWQGYSTLRIGQLQADQSELKSEREWVDAIFAKYVEATTNATYQLPSRIAHLSVLVVMTEMIGDQHRSVREKLGKAIHEQAEIYRTDVLRVKANAGGSDVGFMTGMGISPDGIGASSGTASALLARLDAVQNAAAALAPPVEARRAVSWGNYDFEIFWCEAPGGAADRNFRTANAIASLKALDPEASGRWRVRALPPERQLNLTGGKTFVINIDAEGDELSYAERLRRAMVRENVVDREDVFEISASPANQTRYFLSVIACEK